MTREEFKPLARRMKLAYQRDSFLGDKETTDLWYEMLQDLEVGMVRKAIDGYIQNSTFPPTIADIRKTCETEREKESKLRSEMREIFDLAIGGYPGTHKMQGNTMVYWNYLTAADTWEERVEKAKCLESEISQYVRECEMDGTINEIMSFTEYLDFAYECEKQHELYS